MVKSSKGKPRPQLRSRNTRSTRGRLLDSADPALSGKLLDEQLRALGLYAANTIGDGNCLFRALSDQLYGSPSRHFELRAQICDWIQRHRDRYEPFVEDERGLETHLRCMREHGTYGGHMELSAFAHMTRRNVKVVQPGLVYVIEWAAFFPTSSSQLRDEDSDEGNYDEEYDYDYEYEGGGRSARSSDRNRKWSARERAKEKDKDKDKGKGKGKPSKKDKSTLPKRDLSPAPEDSVEDETRDTIYVAYHDWEHFSSIRNLKGPHMGLPCVREEPPPSVPPSNLTTSSSSGTPSKKEKQKNRKVTLKLGTATSAIPPISTASVSTPDSITDSLSSPPSPLSPLSPMLEDEDGEGEIRIEVDPATVPLPDSRVASPFPSTSRDAGKASTVTPHMHPLRESSVPFSSQEPNPNSGSSLLDLPLVMSAIRSTASPEPTAAAVVMEEGQGAGPAFSPSPSPSPYSSSSSSSSRSKRVYGADGDEEGEGGDGGGRRSVSAHKRSRMGSLDDVTSRPQEPRTDVSSADVDEDGIRTPALSSGVSTASTSPSLESSEEVESEAERELLQEPVAMRGGRGGGRGRGRGRERSERPLTRRQRKQLGLPKPRPGVASSLESAGKIVIPGGRFRKDDGGVKVKVEADEGAKEWVKNGSGRVDVRGFRELKI